MMATADRNYCSTDNERMAEKGLLRRCHPAGSRNACSIVGFIKGERREVKQITVIANREATKQPL